MGYRPSRDDGGRRRHRKRGAKWMKIEKNFRDTGNSGWRKRILTQHADGTCEMSGKVPFPTQKSCAEANRAFRGSVYLCQHCNCWHFTKQVKKPENGGS